ncbi:predicted protein [Lichtheimia corymbifera JMRC:FSU:9682]|uniref:Uncharacterized protein n=1 Tax=Lichtheimia corymbifera JMRC:FSU:9682 TaxID=1263082 RepID=A0A068RUI2_9FUNG|nr:predicted protein [Lichtheimia corymbifera JMRC:FSU:9682]
MVSITLSFTPLPFCEMNPLVDHIRLTLRACFKGTRLSPSAFDSLLQALTCLAIGLRAAHLVDVCNVGSDRAVPLITQLRQHPLCKSLVLLQFGQDYTFICHRETLQSHLDTTLNKPEQWDYVDVRGKQGPPIKRSSPPPVLINWLQQRLLPFLNQKDDPFFLSRMVPYYMVALTGWLLEYPIIYCSHDEDPNETTDNDLDCEWDPWQVRPNCLGDRPLCLVRVWIIHPHQRYMLLSFTYPKELTIASPVAMIQSKYQHRLLQVAHDDHSLEFIRGAHVDVSHETVTLDRVAL